MFQINQYAPIMYKTKVMYEQGAAPNHEIVLSAPYLIINPFNNPDLYNKIKKKYTLYLNTRDEVTRFVHQCESILVDLPLISNHINRSVKLRVYHKPSDDCFVRRLDRFLINRYFSKSTKLAEKVLCLIAAKELYDKDLRTPTLNWIGPYYEEFAKLMKTSEAFSHIKEQFARCCLEDPLPRTSYWVLPPDFNCMCQWLTTFDSSEFCSEKLPELQETGYFDKLTNFGKFMTCGIGTIFFANKLSEVEYKKIYGDLTADLMLLITNFNMKTVIWAFVKLINSLVPVFDIFSAFINILKDVFKHIVNFFTGSSPQSSLEPTYLYNARNETITVQECSSVEPDPYAFQKVTTEDIQEMENVQFTEGGQETWFSYFISTLKMTAPMFAAVMATVVVLLTSAIIGKNVYDGNTDSKYLTTKAQRIGESFAVITKTCNGIKTLTQILTELPKRIYDLVFEMFCGKHDEVLLRLLDATDIRSPLKKEKREFFDTLEFMVNPMNLVAICRNDEKREELIWCHNILSEMSRLAIFEQKSVVDSRTYGWLQAKLKQIRDIMATMLKTPSSHRVKFVPFWINLIGASGLGKSTIGPLILDSLKQLLDKWPNYEQIPSEEGQWVYHMNFCNKYMVGYTGQHAMFIDDVFQDATPMSDCIPSSLLLIQLVSNIPYTTVQAAIEDKGIEFSSKIILTTSNDKEINRKEIVDKTALIRRMNFRVHVERSNTPDKEINIKRGFHTNIKFNIMSYDGKDILHTVDFTGLMAIMLDKYQQWYQLQNSLINSTSATPELMDSIIREMEKGEIGSQFKLSKYERVMSNDATVKTVNPYKSKDPDLKNKLAIMKASKEVQEQKPTTSKDLSVCSSYYCKMGLEPNIKNYLVHIHDRPHYMEQYECECDTHLGYNLRFKEHYFHHARLQTGEIIPSIRSFVRLSVTTDPILTGVKHIIKDAWNFICNVIKTISTHPMTLVVGVVGAVALVYYNTWNTCALPTLAASKLGITALSYSAGRSVKGGRPNLKVIKLNATNCVLDSNEMPEEYKFAIPNKNTYDLACRKIIGRDYMVVLVMKDQKTQAKRCNTAIRIEGTCMLTNHHFMYHLKDGDEFEVLISNRVHGLMTKKQVFSSKRYCRIPGEDLGVYHCDNAIPSASSIISHFTDKEVPDMTHHGIVITIFDPKTMVNPIIMGNVVAKPQKYFVSYGENNQHNILNTYETNATVTQGQSGSLLISTESKMMNKILGILVCQNKDTQIGFFKPVTQQQLKTAISNLKVSELNVTSYLDLEVKNLTFRHDDNVPEYYKGDGLNYVGRIGVDSQVSQQVGTRIIPSCLHNKEELHFEPAVLHNKDERMRSDLIGKSVILRALEGFDHPIGSIDTHTLNIAVEDLSIEYKYVMEMGDGNKPRLLTDYETVNGIAPFLNPVDMHTSPGYPYVLERPKNCTGKKVFFTENQDENGKKTYTMKDLIRTRFEEREKQARLGNKVSTIVYACLKDETRAIKKIKEGKTRLFTCLPMCYNMLVRKYFGSFIIAQHRNAGKIASCVGINQATDWFRLYSKLREKNIQWEDFDYANWDQHLHPELIMSVAKIVNYWYGDKEDSENAKVRRVLLYDLIHTVLLVRDKLYLKSSGQCSGCAITAELNCIVHDLLMYYVWRKIKAINNETTSLEDFREKVSYIIYGDDIVMSTEPETQKIFNGNTIKNVLDTLGMVITPGDKESKDFKLKDPKDITFLKRNFVIDPRSYNDEACVDNCLAPLRQDIVDNIMQWVHKSDDDVYATRTNCETALREYFMYGEDMYVIQRDRINERIAEYNKRNLKKMLPITLNFCDLSSQYEKGLFTLVGMENIHSNDI